MKNENKYQPGLIKRIKERFPGCMVLKNDANYIQGIPDLTVLYEDRWACLETKKDSKASYRPNQPYYIAKMNKMSFASRIEPDNEQEVLDAMERSFATGRSTRLLKRKQA